MRAGEAFWLETANAKKVLCFIFSDTENHPSEFVAAPISRVYDPICPDNSCILMAGEHPSIKHDSFVFYNRAHIISAREYSVHTTKGLIKPAASLASPAVLQKIRDGARKTTKLMDYVKKFLIRQGFFAEEADPNPLKNVQF